MHGRCHTRVLLITFVILMFSCHLSFGRKYLFDYSNSLEEDSYVAVAGAKEDSAEYDLAYDSAVSKEQLPPIPILKSRLLNARRQHMDLEPSDSIKHGIARMHPNAPIDIQIKAKENNHKRYAISSNPYLTLCHFKICNLGRKRTTRYLEQIDTLDNDSK